MPNEQKGLLELLPRSLFFTFSVALPFCELERVCILVEGSCFTWLSFGHLGAVNPNTWAMQTLRDEQCCAASKMCW